MDEKCRNWLEQTFFYAFEGNQKVIYATLKGRYRLEFSGRSYAQTWDELSSSYGAERLCSIVKEEVLDRLSSGNLDEMRKLFWSDETPTPEVIERFDRRNYRAWVDTLSGMIDDEWIEWVVQWSPFANFWFQCLDPKPPEFIPPPPQPQAGAFAEGLDNPEPLFKKWLEWKGARVRRMDDLPADVLVATTKSIVHVVRWRDQSMEAPSAATGGFIQELIGTVRSLQQWADRENKRLAPIACSLYGFNEEARALARDNGIELWGTAEVVSNWMRAGAIGIAHDGGRWYVVGSPSARPKAHLTAKRRVLYS